ncbi:hypothetical protein QLL95_gp1264 [Cotonvirus japonicus]|uniref:Uncharacterized protein n=1 Tax=Cotonvirus japonicus TaxID=2811091 RepID=A0ABM7NRT6_9VIRU|nr:hypothetical protein QLL95_gp1264 [Cotonvirus japonicus]BCS82859.1 hypothetical protein [Cotonvirus japonicus]
MGNYISFKKEFGLIVVGAIIFTASYLWKDLLLEIENKFFPKGYGLTWRIIYTLLITIILVLVAIHLKSQFGLLNTETQQELNKKNINFDDSPIRDSDTGHDSDIGVSIDSSDASN